VIPPTKAIALVEFAEGNDAKRAFQALSYKRFKHVPLYLEWTPECVFKGPAKAKPANLNPELLATFDTKREIIEQEVIDNAETTTIYVKNLNFSTTEDQLQNYFAARIGNDSVLSVKIAKTKKKGALVSLGYGFVELKDKQSSVKAIKLLQVIFMQCICFGFFVFYCFISCD
jgi:multiple RNA-binding domain-containing protein 1